MASFSPTPRVLTFDILSQSFAIVQKNLGTYAVATLVVFIASSVAIGAWYCIFSMLGMGIVGAAGNSDAAGGALLFSGLFSLLVLAALMAFIMPLMFCIPYGILREARGEQITMSNIFQLGDNWLQLAMLFVALNIAIVIGSYLCIIPGLIAQVVGYMAIFHVRDRKTPVSLALQESWRALQPNLLIGIGLMFVAGIISQLGIIACGVGLLFTLPIGMGVWALMYRTLFDDAQPAQQAYPGWQ